ncbi:MAG: SGNH/GDSL hydrolase family protein [Gammaproteobacteria bacterium]|nr:SGNH/GDSL hydrolase family protein [Gammaproteobacteria bacterium]
MNRPTSATQSRAGSRGWVSGFIAVLVGLALAALAAEGVTRVFFTEAVLPRFVVDSGYGVRWNESNIDTRHYVPGDYDVRITTNSSGMRGSVEHAVEPSPGVERILILGDSFAFGYGVEDDEVVSSVLADLLNAPRTGTPRYETINLAVSGFGQGEELITYEERGRAYKPAVVAIFYFENDVGNNAVSQLYTENADGTVTRTGNAYLPGSKLQERLFAITPIRWLFEHSQAWNLIRNRLSALVQNALLREQGLAKFDDATTPALGLTRALLLHMANEIRADGARVIFVVIPNQGGLQSNFPLTAEEVAAAGATLVDGREFLTVDDYYRRDGHWRPSGHRKAAEKLAAQIPSLPAAAPARDPAAGT